MKLVSVIVLSYNGKAFLDDCFESLSKQTYPKFEVILVDNASSDGTIEYARQHFKNIKIIANKDNMGFPEGNNIGARAAKGEYLAFLNQDTVVEKDWLAELVRSIENGDDIGAAQSKMLLFNEKNKINATHIAMHFLGFGWCGNFGVIDKDQFEAKEITFPSGASFIVRKKIFDEVGGFDKDFFLYYEDSDLGWRIRLKGYKIMFAPKSKMYHKYSFRMNPKKMYYQDRNRLVYMLKNYGTKTLLLIFPAFLVTEIGIWFYALVKGWFLDKLRGYWWILSHLSLIMEKRAEVQKTRKITDGEIIKFFLSKIEFEGVRSVITRKILDPTLTAYWNVIKRFI